MGYAERANHGGNGKDHGDQHTISARQMVVVMLNAERLIARTKDRLRVAVRPVDVTPLILDTLSAQSRTLAFILDELLVARGQERAIVFGQPDQAEPSGPKLVV